MGNLCLPGSLFLQKFAHTQSKDFGAFNTAIEINYAEYALTHEATPVDCPT